MSNSDKCVPITSGGDNCVPIVASRCILVIDVVHGVEKIFAFCLIFY